MATDAGTRCRDGSISEKKDMQAQNTRCTGKIRFFDKLPFGGQIASVNPGSFHPAPGDGRNHSTSDRTFSEGLIG
ncbi:MAG: hypothetical protein PVJ53_15445 [Desulfobacterales bacterium]